MLRRWVALAMPLVARHDFGIDPLERATRHDTLLKVGRRILAYRGDVFLAEICEIVGDHQFRDVISPFTHEQMKRLRNLATDAQAAQRSLQKALRRMMRLHQESWQTAHWRETWDASYETYRLARIASSADPAVEFWSHCAAAPIPRGNPKKARNQRLRAALTARGLKRQDVSAILRGIGFTSVIPLTR